MTLTPDDGVTAEMLHAMLQHPRLNMVPTPFKIEVENQMRNITREGSKST